MPDLATSIVASENFLLFHLDEGDYIEKFFDSKGPLTIYAQDSGIPSGQDNRSLSAFSVEKLSKKGVFWSELGVRILLMKVLKKIVEDPSKTFGKELGDRVSKFGDDSVNNQKNFAKILTDIGNQLGSGFSKNEIGNYLASRSSQRPEIKTAPVVSKDVNIIKKRLNNWKSALSRTLSGDKGTRMTHNGKLVELIKEFGNKSKVEQKDLRAIKKLKDELTSYARTIKKEEQRIDFTNSIGVFLAG